MTPSLADTSEVVRLVAALRDPRTAEPARTFPRDTGAATQPGLYAWWVDAEGLRVLIEQLQTSHLCWSGRHDALVIREAEYDDAVVARSHHASTRQHP